MAVSIVLVDKNYDSKHGTDAQTQENGRTPRPDFKRKLVVVGDGGKLNTFR
jgi:hypothetical protein